jgi:SAM-dependent methyltransferase
MIDKCPSCLNETGPTHQFTQNGIDFTVVFCDKCGLYYSQDRLSDDELIDHYTGGAYTSKPSFDLEERKRKSLPLNVAIVRTVEQLNPTRHLDFGCAQGNLMEMVPWPVVGVEITPAYVEAAKDLGLEVYPTLDEVEGVFDLITLVEVLEHMPCTRDFLQELSSRLQKDGYIFITVPGVENDHPQPISTVHLVAFTHQSLAKALSFAEIVPVSQTDLGHSIVYVGRKM